MEIDKAHLFELHPQLTLVHIPNQGLGYRATAPIPKGAVLLTESSFCSGALTSNNDDHDAVSQFIERFQRNRNRLGELYPGYLSVASLTTTATQHSSKDDDDDGATLNPTLIHNDDGDASSSSSSSLRRRRTWVQQCLNNNMYQCRREPHHAALFIALSRFNHSCHPNAVNDATRHVARLRAVCDIREGEQVTISYVPVGDDLERRTEALGTFGFKCGCGRCIRERECDPLFCTKCDECGGGGVGAVRVMKRRKTSVVGDDDDGDDPFSSAREASPCLVCGSSSVLEGTNVEERHLAVLSAHDALQQYCASIHPDDSSGDNDNPHFSQQQQRAAETALLLAPFPTHPDTMKLQRGLIRFLEKNHKRTKSMDSKCILVREQLREIQRLDQAHSGAKHRDLHFLRCFARIVKRCRVVKDCGGNIDRDDDDAMVMLEKYVTTRWENLCLLHFGESDAPDSFMADTGDVEVVVKYVPIGCGDEQLALFDGDDEIDLSDHDIGDEGCAVLCRNLCDIDPLCVLDLDSNGLTSVGGIALGKALAGGAAPLLTHVDLMCNRISGSGACALSTAIETGNCNCLEYLDLHGNEIGDEGCVALGRAFSTGACERLLHLNLSVNGIDDEGCAALSSLFTNSNSSLAYLDLSENFIQNCSSLFSLSSDGKSKEAKSTSTLQFLNLSWNCIAITDFQALNAVFAGMVDFTSLVDLKLAGNALSDRECIGFCTDLQKNGYAPSLEYEEINDYLTEFSCNDEARLRQCLCSLADGDTINPRVCEDEIWLTRVSVGDKELCAQPIENSACCSKDLLERDGYFVVPRLFPQWCNSGKGGGYHSMEELAAIMDRLDLAGWPPVFCFMCDAVWDLVATRLWDEMRLILGDDCVLEPSVFAWSLQAKHSDTQIGQSFGLPHRDYPASEAMFDDGKTPKLLNVWIPVNDATLDTEFDDNFVRPENYAHMRSATAVKGSGFSKLRFSLNGSRAVPAVAGSLLSWCGNTVHWGGSCSQHSASPPRKSIAMTFRRQSVAQLEGAGAPITQSDARNLSSDMRLALIARSLLLYNQWHQLKSDAVPSVFYDVTRT
ncbi:hypothetical protein ACHAXR_012916 [Thalassiosira sp. AJA248-18]